MANGKNVPMVIKLRILLGRFVSLILEMIDLLVVISIYFKLVKLYVCISVDILIYLLRATFFEGCDFKWSLGLWH